MEKIARKSVLKWLALAGIACLPTIAQAQVVSADYRPSSKTEAILGGSSALAAIMAQQAGQPASPAQAMVVSAALASPNPYFQHAPYAATPVVRPAVLPVPADRPDIFNSVALRVNQSPLDQRFRQASGAAPTGAAAAFAASIRDRGDIAKVEAVNAYVNGHVRFVDDIVQFHVADRWQSVVETLARGRGDCEDFALAKRAMLRAAGVAERDLYLVVLKDLTRHADHSVLVVRANGRFLVLDNGTDRIVDSASVQDYKPILTFTQGKVWTHGYRRDALPTVTYASAEPPQKVELADVTVEPASGDSLPPAIASLPFSLGSVGL
ncbi:transglutaminase-like cysteine peptidase [Sphingomonas jaspsi]|uniref:transglutaminase-like cysteine peptidase n=1 Tax=Sphingomonas jaspsi TaxID=392409 RepID=UPI0004BA97EB|nr:transglutaminase-like cysteine peptidase [Sphingomonas jaspsi]